MEARGRWGWYFYAAANSAFSTSVLTVFAGPYLTEVAKARADTDGLIVVGGLSLSPPELFSYVLTASILLRLMTLPLLGALAELAGRNRPSLFVLAFSGAASTVFLGVIPPHRIGLLAFALLTAIFAWAMANVFYNALLPVVATPANLDSVSFRGSAAGYLGGGLVLAAHLLLVQQAGGSTVAVDNAVQMAFVSSGIWWGALSIVSLVFMRRIPEMPVSIPAFQLIVSGLYDLKHRWESLRRRPGLLPFLTAFSLYNAGVQTVLALAGQFAFVELRMSMEQLAGAILFLQFLAAPFPFVLDKLASLFGPRKILVLCLVIWIAILFGTWRWIHTSRQFYVSLVGIAIVVAGTEALSRSLFSRMIADGEEARMFSIYEIAGTSASWCGPFLFGVLLNATRSLRLALLSVLLFFVLGLIPLLMVEPVLSLKNTKEP